MKTFGQIFLRYFRYFRSWLVLATIGVFCLPLQAKVDPPNYDFSLDKFRLFMPDSKQADIKKEYPKEELVLTNGPFKTYKYYVEHIRYRFPILVQYKDGVVIDFHARLPTYFLHDIFHQSLINRFGKQDVFKNKKEQAIYIWKNQKGNRHYYVGACTITCFPIFYAVRKIEIQDTGAYKPILEQLKTSEEKTKQPQPNGAGT